MTADDHLELVRRLGELWPIETERTCIASTRLALTALARLGVKGRAVACEVIAANAAALPLIGRVLVADWPPEAWSVGVRIEPSPYDGTAEPFRQSGLSVHVVAAGDGWLLDVTAPQFHRPLRDLIVPRPILALTDGRQLVPVDLERGGLLTYRLHPEVARFRTTHAWQSADLSWAGQLAEAVR